MATTSSLVFSQVNGRYIASADVTADFALHLEAAAPADIVVSQMSDSNATKAAPTDSFARREVLDVQYRVLVPATIYVESSQPITLGSITA